ncbi:MAG: hypothetical protein IT385_10255 [Deltaproteobacteria bacterium]|nr:hypothetical protein [Deltaproteobacteria bacterium]
MTLPPKEWARVDAFRKLIKQTLTSIEGAAGQGALAAAASDAAGKWDATDAEFASLLRDLAQSVWQMPFAQVRPTVQAIVNHLRGELADVERQLA